jgi:hypothetical protein
MVNAFPIYQIAGAIVYLSLNPVKAGTNRGLSIADEDSHALISFVRRISTATRFSFMLVWVRFGRGRSLDYLCGSKG